MKGHPNMNQKSTWHFKCFLMIPLSVDAGRTKLLAKLKDGNIQDKKHFTFGISEMENIPVSRLTSWSLLTDISGRPLSSEDSEGSSTAPQPDKARRSLQ